MHPTSEAPPVPFSYRRHMLLIGLLYLAQGLSQGVIATAPTFLIKRIPSLVSPTLSATITLPLYAFSMKFLWSPFIDVKFVGPPRYRRASWIVPLQLILSIGFLLLSVGSWEEESLFQSLKEHAEDYNPATHSVLDLVRGGPFGTLILVYCALAVAASMQDVAVDAWAVEGLPPKKAGYASSLQMLGLVSGTTMCSIFIFLYDRSPTLTLSLFFAICSGVAAVGALFAAVHAWISRGASMSLSAADEAQLLDADTTGVMSSYRAMWAAAKERDFRWMVALLWCIGVGSAPDGVGYTNLVRRKLLTADFAVTLDLGSKVVSLAAGAAVARSLRTKNPCDLVRWETLCHLPLILAGVGGYLVSIVFGAATASAADLATWPPTLGWMDWFWVVQTAVGAALSSASFVGMGALIAAVARKHTLHQGCVLTLLFALSNAGRSLPGTVAMYAADPLQQWILDSSSMPRSVVEGEWGGWQPILMDNYLLLSAVAFTAAALLRLVVFPKGLRFLRITVLTAQSGKKDV